MRLRSIFLTFVTLICTAGLSQAAGPQTAESEESAIRKAVLAANDEMNKAAESLDVGLFFDWILDEAEGPVIQDGRLFRTREEALAVVEAGYQGIRSQNRSFDRTFVTVLSKEAALLTSSGTSKIVLMDGRSIEAPFAVSLVYVLRNGQWKIIQGHYSVPNR